MTMEQIIELAYAMGIGHIGIQVLRLVDVTGLPAQQIPIIIRAVAQICTGHWAEGLAALAATDLHADQILRALAQVPTST